MDYRVEKDSLGEVLVPSDKLWGAQTQRALNNFRISGEVLPTVFLESLIRVKKACALSNKNLGVLSPETSDAIIDSCNEVLEKGMWDQFPIDFIQTGSGTQTNMNANEVLANLSNIRLGGKLGEYSKVHPNDHVNKGQSSNDVIPTAMYVSVAFSLKHDLFPSLEKFIQALELKADEFKEVLKIGRTHLQDAVPMSMGQEFSTFATQLRGVYERLKAFFPSLTRLPIGGTAVGTGLNSHPQFAREVCRALSKEVGINFSPVENKFSRISAHDEIVLLSGLLRTLATVLIKISNDLRFYGSGPRCGLGELILPANEPGSSIMPGKVNPTQFEAMVQGCLLVIGNDVGITSGGFYGGQFNLNTAKPLMIYLIHKSIQILSNLMESVTEKAIKGIRVNENKLKECLEKSLMLATALTPKIGYDKASKIAQKAYKEDKTIKQVVLELGLFSEEELESLLDVRRMAFPHAQGKE